MIARYANREEEVAASNGPNPVAEVLADAKPRSEEQSRIRPYRPEDRPAICRLCCETGFLGNPIDPVYQDRELFAELFTRPYLDHQSEWALVVEVNGRVVGYLLGSVCPNFDRLQLGAGFK